MHYLAHSVFVYALLSAPIFVLLSAELSLYWKAFCWMLVMLVGPAAIGVLWGIFIRKDVFRSMAGRSRLLRWMDMNLPHIVPAAWDWKFGDMEEEWVLVTLKNGGRVAGYCGPQSFVSSDPGERDIYIQKVFEVGDDEKWTGKDMSVLIAGGEISTIEFWPVKPKPLGGQDE